MSAGPPDATLAPAAPHDRAEIEALLAASSLPLDGLEATDLAIVRVAGALAGVAGLELYGEHALLRSVAVAPAWRGRGIAAALVAERVAHAKALAIDHPFSAVWLLTTGAADYFARLGFAKSDRKFLPPAMLASPQLAVPACSSAVVMRRPHHATTDDQLDAAVDARLARAGTLVPPWIEFPEIRAGSIGWRMGSGEWYLWMWQRWWARLDETARDAYRARWPAPPGWRIYESSSG